jgi:hypothetical protein
VEGAHFIVMTLLLGEAQVAHIPGRFHEEEVLEGLRDAIGMRTQHALIIEIPVELILSAVGFAFGSRQVDLI